MVPADSDRIPRAPPYSGGRPDETALPVRVFHPLRTDFPDGSSPAFHSFGGSYNPGGALTSPVWALPLSLATTQGIDSFFLFLGVLRCFSSPRSPSLKGSTWPSTMWVAPFGYLRITSCLRIPGAFRSLPRPSSPPEA